MKHWKTKNLSFDFVVCGGGLAGLCAAISAARQGLQVALLHDRTVLGGNSSSEVRVTPHGAAQHHPYARETGIISELLIEERALNHAEIFENGWTNSIWDLVLLTAVLKEPNIELFLNTKVVSAQVENRTITRVQALVLDSETQLFVQAPTFLDATGDGIVALEAGCEYMTGSEGQNVWNEPSARQPQSNTDTMGNSLMFKTESVPDHILPKSTHPSWKPLNEIQQRGYGAQGNDYDPHHSFWKDQQITQNRPQDLRQAPYTPASWAQELNDPTFFYGAGRVPNEPRGGFWWVELGMPRHTIYDNASIRQDLQSYILGIWDWMKHQDPKTVEQTRTRALDWIGSVLGTRESRRTVGTYIMKEQDIQSRRIFEDEVAYGGWFLDLHTPGGLIAEHAEENSATNYNPFTEKAAQGFVGPYGIPLSSLIAKDVDNLFLAGRNISASHVALGTMRVMGTTALMGQAVGTSAAILHKNGKNPKNYTPVEVQKIQQQLLRDGAWLPNYRNQDSLDLARQARVSASSQDRFSVMLPGQQSWGESQGMLDSRIKPDFLQRTHTRMSQILCTHGEIQLIRFCLSNHSYVPQKVNVRIVPVQGIYDYQVYQDQDALATGVLEVNPGKEQWIPWDLRTSSSQGLIFPGTKTEPKYVRIEIAQNPDIQWHQAKSCYPGLPAYYEVGQNKIRKLQHGVTLAFAVEPPQECYAPSQVISGVARHHDSTHLWRAAADDETPELELTWEQTQSIQTVELTFPGNLIRSYHAYQPYYRAPETARNYTITGFSGDSQVGQLRVQGNYQRRVIHRFDESIQADRLVITIHSTNGDPVAGIFEVRVYG